jgi:hypothetical protein
MFSVITSNAVLGVSLKPGSLGKLAHFDPCEVTHGWKLLTSAIDSTVDRPSIKNNYLFLLQTSLLSCLRRGLAPSAIDRFITGFCQPRQPNQVQPRQPYRLKIDRIYVLLLSLKKTWGILDLYCASPVDWVAKARVSSTGGYQRGRLLLLRNQPINKSMNTNQEVLCNF